MREKADDATKGGSLPTSFDHFERFVAMETSASERPELGLSFEKDSQREQAKSMARATQLLSHWYAVLVGRLTASLETATVASPPYHGAFPNESSRANDAQVSAIPVWKRALDLAVITLSLPVWLPLMMMIMVFIKVCSPGPVFYRQERVGLGRKRFPIL